MNLREKYIWDLTLDEMEYANSMLHMNRYIYAPFLVYHMSNMPLNKKITIKKSTIPTCISEEAQKLCDLSPILGNGNPTEIRIKYSLLTYKLFKKLFFIEKNELENTLQFLATIAYISICADKDDNLLVRESPIVRKINDNIYSIFNYINDKTDLDKFYNLSFIKDLKQRSTMKRPIGQLTEFILKSVNAIIIMIENRVDAKIISNKFKQVEYSMLNYEFINDVGNKNKFLGNIKYPSQIRYRNTLYLYGGNHFERIKDYDLAFNWYIKDIYFNGIENLFEIYFLTALKTCERLLCAYNIADYVEEDIYILHKIIDKCILKCFKVTADHSDYILNYVEQNPDIDLSLQFIPVYDKENKNELKSHMAFAAETCCEIFDIALLYNKIILGIDYKDIDYEKYLIIEEI